LKNICSCGIRSSLLRPLWPSICRGLHGFECNLDITCASEFFKDLKMARARRTSAIWGLWKTHERMFIQISQETMLLLINNLHKNVRDNCSFNLRVYSEHSTGKVSLALLYHII
jgi:hypothetical protein